MGIDVNEADASQLASMDYVGNTDVSERSFDSGLRGEERHMTEIISAGYLYVASNELYLPPERDVESVIREFDEERRHKIEADVWMGNTITQEQYHYRVAARVLHEALNS